MSGSDSRTILTAGGRVAVVTLIASAMLLGASVAASSSRAGAVGDPQAALTAELTSAANLKSIPLSVQPPVSKWGGLAPYFSYQATPKGRACFATQSQVSLITKYCYWGDTKSTRVAALIGDSQAFQWLPALDQWGLHGHWKILVLTKAACRPWSSKTYLWSDHSTPFPQCPQFNTWVVKTLIKIRPKATFIAAEIGALSATSVESSADVVTGISKLKSSLARSKTRMLLFQNTPWFWNLPTSPACLVAHDSSIATCAQPRAETTSGPNVIEKPMRDAIATIASDHFASVVPVDNLMCSPSECPMLSGSILIYLDDAHITNLWVAHVEPAFAEMVAPLVKGL